MIIDIMDLRINKLNFSEAYDKERYRKGKQIYRNRKVKIKTVEKKADEKIYINALVDGNYGLYQTDLTIKDNLIIESSCTCEDYRKGNICKHIIATSMEAIEPHSPNTENGKKRLIEKQKEIIRLEMEERERQRQEEISKYYYKRKYRTGLETIEKFKQVDLVEGKTSLNLGNIYEDIKQTRKEKKIDLCNSIKLEYQIELVDHNSIKLDFKIGQTRMYKMGDLSAFYKAYKREEVLEYGKQLRFIPKRENFEEKSQKLFDIIIKYAEIIDYNERISPYQLDGLHKKNIFIEKERIDDFFAMEEDRKFPFKINNNDSIYFEIVDEKIKINSVLKKEKVKINTYSWEEDIEESEEYVLRLNLENYYPIYAIKKIYILHKSKIYVEENNEENRRLLKLFDESDRIVIPEDKLKEFEKYVIPQIGEIEIKDYPKEKRPEVKVVDKLASKILLDLDNDGNIILELKFCYKDCEFNILEDNHEEYVEKNKIVRNIPEEQKVIERLFLDGFYYKEEYKNFILDDNEEIYKFLAYKIEGYMKDYEVLATDKFKNKEIKRPKISNVGIRIDNGLLEMNFSNINIDLNEIKDILKSYRVKKKYYKLKNGDFLDLNKSEDLDLLDEISDTLDVDYSKISNGNIKLPISRSYYLENLMKTNKNIKVSKNDEFTSLVDSIENKNLTDEIKIDKDLDKVLRDYQKIGYKWLKTLSLYKFGGILADDMGLGKTIQIIAILKEETKLKSKKPSIVVCPSTLVLNWKSEIEKWCESIKVLIINGTAPERKEKIETYKNYDLIITSYDLLKRDIENYEGKKFKYIIADEAQYIKNASTQNSTSLKALEGETKFALTGTPIENSIAELWSIFDFIMPGYLYNYNKFKKKFEEPILKLEDKESLKRLKKLISPFVLRRVKEDVLTELPEKNITIMKNEMDKEQEKIYLSYLAQTKKEVAQELQGSSFEKSKFKILMLLTRLRQICCHPKLFLENYDSGSGKLDQCMGLVKEAIDGGHKILIFSSYTSMFEIIEKEFEKEKIKYFKLIGKTPVDKRIEMVDDFNNNSNVKVFLISLKSGGTGLNLTSADVVIHYDPWWNLSSENQATDRAYRIGQKNSVQVYKLITSNSIEEKINKMQERKAKLSKDVLSTEETFINKLSKNEILDLFE